MKNEGYGLKGLARLVWWNFCANFVVQHQRMVMATVLVRGEAYELLEMMVERMVVVVVEARPSKTQEGSMQKSIGKS